MRISSLASLERSDLTSCAWLGLYEARQRFNPQQGVQFSTFARLRIRGAIYDGLAETSSLGRRGVRMVKRQFMSSDLPRYTTSQVSQASDREMRDLPKHLSAHHAPLSVTADVPRAHESDQVHPSFLEGYKRLCAYMESVWIHDFTSEEILDPSIVTQERERSHMIGDLISDAFGQLQTQERDLLVAAFDFRGIGDNAKAYAERLGVHRSTIARRLATILLKLKEWIIQHRLHSLNEIYTRVA